MNKRKWLALRPLGKTLTLVIVYAILAVLPMSAQTDKFDANDVWRVSYTVIIKGSGTIEPELGTDDPVIAWRVDRVFKGHGPLEGVDPLRKTKNQVFQSTAGYHSVKIEDQIRKEYPEICEETDEVRETWTLDTTSPDNPVSNWGGVYYPRELIVNPSDRTYSILLDMSLPATIKGRPDGVDGSVGVLKPVQLVYKKRTIHRPKFNEEINDLKRLLSSPILRLPAIPGWTKAGSTHKSGVDVIGKVLRKDLPLPAFKDSSFTIDSGEITLSESMLPGVDTTGKVTIQIIYTLSKNGPKPPSE